MAYLDELLHRLLMSYPDATRSPSGVAFTPPDHDGPVRLLVSEAGLARAVRAIGEDCRDALWPTSSVDEAGFNLLLVHLDEVLATRVVDGPLRISADGLQWPS
jgi:hypothetical protein